MSIKVIAPIVLAIAVFLISYFFFAKSQGQLECSSEIGSAKANKIGGIVGMSLAGVLLLVALGLYLKEKFDVIKKTDVTQML